MTLVFVSEVPECAEYGIGGRPAETAHCRVLHSRGQFLKENHLLERSFACRDVLQDFMHSLGALSTREAFSARFILQEFHEVLRDIDHAGVLIHDDHAARAHDRARLGQAVVVDG